MKSATPAIFALIALAAQQASAQNAPLSTETSQVCAMTLRAGENAIMQVGDWKLAVNNGNSTLQPASFWITVQTTGRLYGGNGHTCRFDPYLECHSNDTNDNANNQQTSRDEGPFMISNNGTLSFQNTTAFFLCVQNAFTEIGSNGSTENTNEDELQDYPYIYPQNADRCFVSTGYTVAPAAAAANSTGLPTATATGTSIASATQGTSMSSATSSGTSVSANAASHTGDSNVVVAGVMLGAAGLFAWL